MTKPKEITHFCEACQVEHTFIEDQFPFWKHKLNVSQLGMYDDLWYCNKGLDCSGCNRIHKKNGITKGLPHPSGKTIWLCAKYYSKYGTGKIDWDKWSPQEVMSAVHLGEDRDDAYGDDTENHDIVQGDQEEAMHESLDELGEFEAQDRHEEW